ncbi:tetratricopeptide repeat protein [Tepidimonas sp.]|uniref:tetratricopeptide repeat protein n=1 Tax=Tepidimonas sp. TaxID=2002775 RepID=UPI002FE116B6
MPPLRSLILCASLCLPLVPAAAQEAAGRAGGGGAETATPSALDAELFYQLLLAELQRRDDPGAAYSLILDAARRTGDPALYRRAVEIAVQARAGNAALEAAQAWARARPADDEARRTQLQLLLSLQRVGESGPVLRDWIRATPPERRPEVIALVPAVLGRSSDAEQALATARTALEPWLRGSGPVAAAAWAALGRLQAQAGRSADALHSGERALQADPSSSAVGALALGLLEALPQQAEGLLQRHLAAAGDKAETAVRIAYASALAERGRLNEALALLRLPDGRTADERARLRLAEARLLRDNDQIQAAYDVLSAAWTADPQHADLQYDLAMLAERLQRLDEMERLLRDLIARRPDDPHPYNALGYALADRGQRLPEAKALIEEALRRAPDDAYIIDSLGWVEFRLGNLAEARRLLTDAMHRRPDPEIAAHLGEVLWVLNEREQARAVWRQGLELDARNRTLRETLRRFGVEP